MLELFTELLNALRDEFLPLPLVKSFQKIKGYLLLGPRQQRCEFA
jgi:hypothetical protein